MKSLPTLGILLAFVLVEAAFSDEPETIGAARALRGDAKQSSPPAAAVQPARSVDRSLPWVTEQVAAPRVAFRTFASEAAAGTVSYHVYAPVAYDEPDARLPVLYWLHGTLGGGAGIRPLSAHFDAEIRAGRMPPLLVVFANGLPRRLWADSQDGSAPVETVFITELIPEVDRSFRTVATREGRILEGFSMGGYGAARLGFAHPHLFAGISILAGGPLDLDLAGPRARRNPGLREFLIRDVCGGDHDYHEIPDVGHDAAAVLTALAATDGDFYRRALAGPAAPKRMGDAEGAPAAAR